MNRLLLVPALGLLAAAVASPASAQNWLDAGRASYVDDQRASFYEARRIAYDNGYREGLKEGEKDARKGDRFHFEDEGDWRSADAGYRRVYGSRDRYRQSFRIGFADGYRDGYRTLAYNRRIGPRQGPLGYPVYPRYPARTRLGYPDYRGYGGGYGYNPAFANGVDDGYEKGREDARDGDSYDPLRHKWYPSGDHNYEREYGPKERYENLYRQGFRQGYERGYRDFARR